MTNHHSLSGIGDELLISLICKLKSESGRRILAVFNFSAFGSLFFI